MSHFSFRAEPQPDPVIRENDFSFLGLNGLAALAITLCSTARQPDAGLARQCLGRRGAAGA